MVASSAHFMRGTKRARIWAETPGPPLEKLRLQFILLQLLVDIALIIGAHSLAAYLYLGAAHGESTVRAAQTLIPLYLTIALYNGTYSQAVLPNFRRCTARMAAALVLSAALFNFIAFYAKASADFSRVSLVLGFALSLSLMALGRLVACRWVRRHYGPSFANLVIIDDGGPQFELPHALRLSAAEHELVPSLADPHLLNRLGWFLHNMEQVIVSCPPERRLAWAQALKGSGLHGELISDLERELGVIGVQRYEAAGRVALIVSAGPLSLSARVTKRLFDIVAAAGMLILLSPLLLAAAVLVTVEDGGPALFRQQRLGRGNRFFAMYKFRTMRVDASDVYGHRSAALADSRVTRVGKLLRKTSIDELPQLFNVLMGQMSIVGPRPHAIGSVAGDKYFWEVDQRYWQRHSLKPGMAAKCSRPSIARHKPWAFGSAPQSPKQGSPGFGRSACNRPGACLRSEPGKCR